MHPRQARSYDPGVCSPLARQRGVQRLRVRQRVARIRCLQCIAALDRGGLNEALLERRGIGRELALAGDASSTGQGLPLAGRPSWWLIVEPDCSTMAGSGQPHLATSGKSRKGAALPASTSSWCRIAAAAHATADGLSGSSQESRKLLLSPCKPTLAGPSKHPGPKAPQPVAPPEICCEKLVGSGERRAGGGSGMESPSLPAVAAYLQEGIRSSAITSSANVGAIAHRAYT